jgi:hypothetical protein
MADTSTPVRMCTPHASAAACSPSRTCGHTKQVRALWVLAVNGEHAADANPTLSVRRPWLAASRLSSPPLLGHPLHCHPPFQNRPGGTTRHPSALCQPVGQIQRGRSRESGPHTSPAEASISTNRHQRGLEGAGALLVCVGSRRQPACSRQPLEGQRARCPPPAAQPQTTQPHATQRTAAPGK